MPQKKEITLAEVKVGVFVIVSLAILSMLILQQSWGIHWFSQSVKVITYLPDVGGLKSGAPVWLAGIEIGRVRQVGIVPPEVHTGNAEIFQEINKLKQQIAELNMIDPPPFREIDQLQDRIRDLRVDMRIVEVRLEISPEYLDRISADSDISIGSRGLIGDSFIDISPGTPGMPPPRKGDYYLIESIQQPGFREIMTGANDVVANFGILTDQFKMIVEKISPEKFGTSVGELLDDSQSAIRQVNETFIHATALIDTIHSGEGTMARIISDPELYHRLSDSLERFNSIIETIQQGEGTIGRLISDPALFESADAAIRKAEVVIDRIEKGEGTLGKLTTDTALYENSRIAVESFVRIMDEIDRGEGTIGMLIKNPSLYNNLDQSTAEISKLLYDIRKDPSRFLTIRFRLF
jgi:phospholipid/cholesterol/gamma-HCH transport system substrate-binding protein